jgi:hypothetical protein
MSTKTALLVLLSCLALNLCACEGLALHDARLKDSPAAYEAFLQQYPDSTEAEALRSRIDELRYREATEAGTAAAYRAYLARHPKGASSEQAHLAEEQLSFSEATAAGTAESLEAYLKAHPKGASVDTANSLLDRVLYRARIGIHELRTEQVNLANDPKGPLDGWAVVADVVNEGRRTVSLVELHVDLLDASGKAEGQHNKWWAVTPDLGAFPTPEAMKLPLAPGASRVFRWTTGAIPENWSQKAGLRVTDIRFEY